MKLHLSTLVTKCYNKNMKTKEKILQTAEELVLAHGVDHVTLTDIATALNMSHAALYKHFRNKDDIWTTLAMRWLDEVLVDVWEFVPRDTTAKTVHDWLLTLSLAKKTAHDTQHDMFTLYTNYIEYNDAVLQEHLSHLRQSLRSKAPSVSEEMGEGLLRATVWFHSPLFTTHWDDTFTAKFETIWALLALNFTD